jgi:hypothetical protein
MEKVVLLVIMHVGLGIYCCPLSAMEYQEKFLAKVSSKRSYSILRQIHHVKKFSLETLARKPRKIKLARRGISAPPSSPELPEIQSSPSMIFENADEGTSCEKVACFICEDRWTPCQELQDHMFYAHHTFLCACNKMYQDCDQYAEHCKTCSIFQETKQAGAVSD